MPRFCYSFIGPHAIISRTRSAIKSRPHRPRVRARRADASQPSETGREAASKEGERNYGVIQLSR